jgi:hypothetical protein
MTTSIPRLQSALNFFLNGIKVSYFAAHCEHCPVLIFSSLYKAAVLRLIVPPCDEDKEKDDQFFLFFQVMEHRWNEIDRGKPKYLGGKILSQCHSVHHKSHMD